MVSSELRARITTDTAGYKRGMADVSRIAAGTAAGVASAFASVLSARAIANQLQQMAAYGDALEEAAQRTSMTVEAVQRLGHAARLSGGDFGQIEQAMRTAVTVIDDASKGSKTATEAFTRLGLSAAVLRTMSREGQFSAIMEGLAGVANETDRAALSADVFGARFGSKLFPMLAGGAAGFRALTTEADRYGLVSAEGVRASVRFADAMGRLQTAGKAARSALGAEVMAALADQIEAVARRIGELQRDGTLQRWGKDAAAAVETAAGALSALTRALVAHKTELQVVLATWAGYRVFTLAQAAVTAMAAALARLGAVMATDTALTVRNTAATVTNAAARKAAAGALEASTVGVNRASEATRALAAGVPVATGAVSKMGQAMAGLKWAGYIGLAVTAAAKTIELARAVAAVGDAMQAAGATDTRPWWTRARDYLPAWMGAQAEGQTHATAPITAEQIAAAQAARRGAGGTSPDAEAAQGRAARMAEVAKAKGEADAKAQKKAFDELTEIYETARKAARVARQTGDAAALEVWDVLTGGADPNLPATAGRVVGMLDRLEFVLKDDPDGALTVIRDRAGKHQDAIREMVRLAREAAADELKATKELLADRAAAAKQIADLETREAERRKAARDAKRLRNLDDAERDERAKARAHYREYRQPQREHDAEARAKRAAERQQETDERRYRAAKERADQGLSVSRRGRELIRAKEHMDVSKGAGAIADRLRAGADAAAFRAAVEPLKQVMNRVDQVLRERLPGDKT